MHLPASALLPWRASRAEGGIRLVIAIAALLVIAMGLPAPAAATSRFEDLRQRDLRVASVAYRLSISGIPLCRHAPVPQLGFILHSLAQYADRDRGEAARSYGLDRRVGVMAVVAGSPAAAAGLLADDRLVSVNGIALSVDVGAQGRDQVDRAEEAVIEAMRQGAVTLRVSGTGGERDLRLRADLGCPSAVELVPDGQVNAWADGARIVVTTAILDQCRSDDELALVIAHEMAHNILHHRKRLAAAGAGMGLLPVSAAGSAEMRETEEEADRFAVRMARAAAYDLDQAAPFLGRLLAANGQRGQAATHPESVRRLALLKTAIAETDSARF